MTLTDALKTGNQQQIKKVCDFYYKSSKLNGKIWREAIDKELRFQEVADIRQEALYILLRNIEGRDFKNERHEQTYYINTCRNLIINDYRNKGKVYLKKKPNDWDNNNTDDYQNEEKVYLNKRVDDWDYTNPELITGQWEKQITAEEEKERNTALRRLINQMKDQCRFALVAYYFSKVSQSEIASVIGLANAGSVATKIGKCRKKLHAVIEQSPVLYNLLKPIL
ncbi:MAG: sigma-70 family RNA polymerase sigma factor [Bacteroidota bacterium]